MEQEQTEQTEERARKLTKEERIRLAAWAPYLFDTNYKHDFNLDFVKSRSIISDVHERV